MDTSTELAQAIEAFYTEHRSCGELDADVTAMHVVVWCSCGAKLNKRIQEGERS